MRREPLLGPISLIFKIAKEFRLKPGKLIESVREFESLRIADVDRSLKHFDKRYSDLLAGIAKFFVGNFVYTWHTYSPATYPVRSDCPVIKHPSAKRPGEQFSKHEKMGREYYSWFRANHPTGEIGFSMAPDFGGRLLSESETSDDIYFWGDFGQVGVPTIFQVLQDARMKPGSLWITVPETGRHLVLECQIYMADFFQEIANSWAEDLYTQRTLRQAA